MEDSLQFLALEQLIKVGVPYDDTCPQVINILFDTRLALVNIEEDIHKKQKALAHLHRKFTSLRPYTPDLTYYNTILEEIENTLFDSFESYTINHIQWKEYFHCLYNLVTIPRTDRYTTIILLKELLKYYEVLNIPVKMLEPEDPMSHVVHDLLTCFRRLRSIHMGLVMGLDIENHFKMHYELEVKYRVDYFLAKEEYENQLALRVRYKTVLNQM